MTKYSELELPDGYGYNHIFKHQIKTRTYGLSGSLIPQIHKLCEGKWGWWFEQNDLYDPFRHNWEEQNSYMSFEKKTDATRFWLAVGLQNMGERSR